MTFKWGHYFVGLFMLIACATSTKSEEADVIAVKAADQAFYAALSGRDIAAMTAVWADKPDVVSIGPRSKKMDIGIDDVKKYWEGAFNYFSKISAAKSEAHIHIDGNVAWITGTETASLQPKSGGDPLVFDTFVTHVFEKQGGKWLLVVHHAQMIPK